MWPFHWAAVADANGHPREEDTLNSPALTQLNTNSVPDQISTAAFWFHPDKPVWRRVIQEDMGDNHCNLLVPYHKAAGCQLV